MEHLTWCSQKDISVKECPTCAKFNITDEEFEKLKKDIKQKWAEYDELQMKYKKLTGLRYEWFK